PTFRVSSLPTARIGSSSTPTNLPCRRRQGWSRRSARLPTRPFASTRAQAPRPPGSRSQSTSACSQTRSRWAMAAMSSSRCAFALSLLPSHQHLLLLKTFSKSYGLAGMRIGFAIGSRSLISALDSVKDSYNLDRLAIVAAKAAIEDEDHHRRIVSAVIEGRDFLIQELTAMKFDLVPPAANFVFTKPPADADHVASALRERR